MLEKSIRENPKNDFLYYLYAELLGNHRLNWIPNNYLWVYQNYLALIE